MYGFFKKKIKIGTRSVVRNEIWIPLLEKALLHPNRYIVDYSEFISIIEGYVTESSIFGHMITESDSILVV